MNFSKYSQKLGNREKSNSLHSIILKNTDFVLTTTKFFNRFEQLTFFLQQRKQMFLSITLSYQHSSRFSNISKNQIENLPSYFVHLEKTFLRLHELAKHSIYANSQEIDEYATGKHHFYPNVEIDPNFHPKLQVVIDIFSCNNEAQSIVLWSY